MKFGVVGDLLNEISIGEKSDNMHLTWLRRDQIIKNPKNGYAVGDVEGLAEDIKRSGLAQPLEVLPQQDGTYRLITGERRLTAIDKLIQSGDWLGEIPCIERSLEDYGELGLSDESKELYAIIRTNRYTRKMSDADLYFEAEKWADIIQEMKANGKKELTDGDGNGNRTSIDISGRTREAVARTLHVSNGQIGKIDYIRKNAAPDIQDAVKNGSMTIAEAYQAAVSATGPDGLGNRKNNGKKKDKKNGNKSGAPPAESGRKAGRKDNVFGFDAASVEYVLGKKEQELEGSLHDPDVTEICLLEMQMVAAGLRLLLEKLRADYRENGGDGE